MAFLPVPDSVLVQAIRRGNVDEVRGLLAKEEIRATAAANDNQALLLAIELGSIVMVNDLLEVPEVRANAHQNNNRALQYAVRFGVPIEVTNSLLGIPEVRATAAGERNLVLAYAAIAGRLDIVKRLIEDPELPEILATELRAVASDRDSVHSAVVAAARSGRLNVLNYFLAMPQIEAAAGVRNNLLLCEAAIGGSDSSLALNSVMSFDVVSRLLLIPTVVKAGVNVMNNEPLRNAARAGFLQVVDLFLQRPEVRAAVAADNHRALRETVFQTSASSLTMGHVKPEKQQACLAVAFRLLQAYKAEGIDFPRDINVEGHSSLSAFFESYPLSKPINVPLAYAYSKERAVPHASEAVVGGYRIKVSHEEISSFLGIEDSKRIQETLTARGIEVNRPATSGSSTQPEWNLTFKEEADLKRFAAQLDSMPRKSLGLR